MNRALALMLLLGSAAHAQIVRPLGETPGDLGPTSTTTPEKSTGGATSGARFSAFSAGRGGALFAFSQGVDGLVLGAVIGASITAGWRAPLSGAQGLYLGALAGGVTLGALGSLLQHLQPIGLVAAGATSLGLLVGALAGFGVAALLPVGTAVPGLLALVGSQVGGLVPLALSWAAEDLDPSDLAMMGAAALSAFALTGLLNLATGRPLVPAALLLAPAVGMAIGGLIAALTSVPVATIFRYAGLPLGAALALFALVSGAFESVQLGAAVALGGAAITLGVTALVSVATTPAEPQAVSLVPTLVVLPGRGSELSVGPGAVVTF
ncbi:MAG: hypothetical protein GQE15_25550 [Archangiaceae bacterium]|nr:hypothetical protein [Archangiaceae bacterium]